MEGEAEMFYAVEAKEQRVTSETQPVNSLTRPQHRIEGWRNN